MFVAIIDDDPIFRYVCHNLFKKIEEITRIDSFDDAESAIETWFGENKPETFPDVVFLDINMNAVDGWGLLDYMQKNFPKGVKPRVFIASSSPLNEDINRAKNHIYGVNGYLVKPLTMKKLYEVLNHKEKTFLMIY